MKRLILFLAFPLALVAQQPVPELSLTANRAQDINLYPGWPLLVNATIMNSQRFSGGLATPVVIAPTGVPWTSAIQFTAVDSSDQAHQWPLNLIGTPADPVLTLAPTSYVRFTLQMAPADVALLAPGNYQLTATVQVSNSTGWNGAVQSRPVTIQVGPEPSLTPEEQTEKAVLLSGYQANTGDLDGALATMQQLLVTQPNDPIALSAAAHLMELAGAPELALVRANSALAAYYQGTTDLSEAPSNLLSMSQRLATVMISPNSSASPTSVSASSAEVIFSPSDQTVTLSATVLATGTAVDGGAVTFSITGAGNPVTSAPVTQGNATALFTIPGGTHAGSYPIVASYNGTALFSASSDSTSTLKIDKATPVISWSNPAPITDGAALGSTQLNATANVPGTFNYNPPAGTLLPVGSGETLSVTFTPSDTTDYNSVSANVSISVIPASLTITAPNTTRQYGQANPPLNNVTYSGFVNGDTASSLGGTLFCATSAAPMSSVGSYAITCSGLTSPNYSITFVPGTLTITPAPLAVAANNATRPYGANNPALTGMVTGLQNADPIAANFATTALPTSAVGAYAITPVVLDPANRLGNYTLSLVNGTLSVVPENTALSVAISPTSISVGQSATVTVTLAASDMVIPIDPSVLGPITLTSPIVSDILSNNGVCVPVAGATPGIASCTVTVTSIEPNGRTLNAAFAGSANLAASAGKADLTVTAALQSQQVCIRSDFRNVPVAGGNTIWFNSIFKVREVSKQLVHISFFQAGVQFQYRDASGSLVTVNQALPDAHIIIDPSAATASTAFDSVNNVWNTTLPWDMDDNAFLTGMPWLVPAGGIPGDIEPVTVCGTFASDAGGIDIGWRWAAAVYSSFGTDGTTLGVKPMDTDHDNQGTNRDLAGTPENFKQFAIPGARGKGGKNYTGSYSGSKEIE